VEHENGLEYREQQSYQNELREFVLREPRSTQNLETANKNTVKENTDENEPALGKSMSKKKRGILDFQRANKANIQIFR